MRLAPGVRKSAPIALKKIQARITEMKELDNTEIDNTATPGSVAFSYQKSDRAIQSLDLRFDTKSGRVKSMKLAEASRFSPTEQIIQVKTRRQETAYLKEHREMGAPSYTRIIVDERTGTITSFYEGWEHPDWSAFPPQGE